jgi:hypothetical protein
MDLCGVTHNDRMGPPTAAVMIVAVDVKIEKSPALMESGV